MTRRRMILLPGATVCLAVAVVLAALRAGGDGGDTSDFPDGTFWVCQECGAEFVKTIAELDEIHRRTRELEGPGAVDRVPCPECGSTNVARALRCSECGRFFVRSAGRGQPVCPHCNTPQAPRANSGD